MKPAFEIPEVFRTAWKTLKLNIWILVGLIVGYAIIYFLLYMFSPSTISVMSVIISLIMMLLAYMFQLGYTKNIFQALDGIEPQFSAYGQQARKVLTLIVSTILSTLLVMVGFLLFIIPGIYLALRFQFFLCFIVEEDAGILESLQKSWAITKEQFMPLLVLFFVYILIAIIGILLFGVGIFVALPLLLLMQCYVYRKLNAPVTVTQEILE